jgi:N-hydroxyarylamine O-acetyltransferase
VVCDRRYALSNNEFVVHDINGNTERRLLATGAEIRRVLEEPFGLALPTLPKLDAVLDRLAGLTT